MADSLGQEALRAVLDDPQYVESATVIPNGTTQSQGPFDVRIERKAQMLERNNVQSIVYPQAIIKIFAINDSIHGGYVNPVVGDNWTVAPVRGGTAVSGWMAGPPALADGVWHIPVTFTNRIETGGHRHHGGTP